MEVFPFLPVSLQPDANTQRETQESTYSDAPLDADAQLGTQANIFLDGTRSGRLLRDGAIDVLFPHLNPLASGRWHRQAQRKQLPRRYSLFVTKSPRLVHVPPRETTLFQRDLKTSM